MCWFFHKWSKWITTRTGNIGYYAPPDYKYVGNTGTYIEQERTCERCGKIQARTQTNYFNS